MHVRNVNYMSIADLCIVAINNIYGYVCKIFDTKYMPRNICSKVFRQFSEHEEL